MLEKPVAHSTASKFSAVLIGRVDSRNIYLTLWLRRLKKDILMHLAEVAAEFRRKADASLAPTTKRLLFENYQLNVRVTDMYDEIKLLQQQSVEWKAEDARQVNNLRDLTATNAQITRKNITLAMVRSAREFAFSVRKGLNCGVCSASVLDTTVYC